jgi:hypothetical protein
MFGIRNWSANILVLRGFSRSSSLPPDEYPVVIRYRQRMAWNGNFQNEQFAAYERQQRIAG